MTKQELEKIKVSKRWSVTFEDIYSRYVFIFIPLAIVFIGFIGSLAGFRNNSSDLKTAAFIILTVGIILTVFIAKRLYQNQVFEIYQVPGLTKDKIGNALKKTNLNNVKYHKLGYFVATTNTSWFSWGEQITIIPDNNQILINSKPTGSAFSFQPITIIKDRKNIKTIIDELTKLQNT